MDTEIVELWPTPFWFGHIAAPDLADVAALTDPACAVDITSHRDDLKALQQLQEAAAAIAPGSLALTWKHILTVWTPGFHFGMGYSAAAIRAFVVVVSNAAAEHPESGTISLHDPRAGAANVALPGLPWGRAAKIPAVAGAAVAFPGWLACSVAPLRDLHTMTVWTAEAA